MNVLLVDDDKLLSEEIAEFLETQFGYQVSQCADGRDALDLCKKNHFSLIMTDIRLPGLNGLNLLKELKESPETKSSTVIILTGYGELEYAIQAMRLGAYDFLLKPVKVTELIEVIQRFGSRTEDGPLESSENENAAAESAVEKASSYSPALHKTYEAYIDIKEIGRIGIFSKAMCEIVDMCRRFHNDRSIPVLIEGETGTGKEIIARLIHDGGENVNSPFVPVNCSAIPLNLFESELFGYEGGAFTSSKISGMKGKFELAQGGTIFLDEIGDLPEELQPKLLRTIQEKEVYRVGGLKKIKLDARIICATNRNLDELVAKGKLRKDLYYRLNRGRITIPPLAERKEAIAPMAQLFLEDFAQKKGRQFKFIDKEAASALENYSWPGNVRELQNIIERAVLLYDDIALRPYHLKLLHLDQEGSFLVDASGHNSVTIALPPEGIDIQKLELEIIKKVLVLFNGNKTKASEYLRITRKTLRSKLVKTV